MPQLYTLTEVGEPVLDLESDVKAYLKLESCADDDLLRLLAEAVTTFAEKYMAQELRVNKWRITIDCFDERIELRRHPINTVDSITYTDENEAEQTVDAAVYYLKKGQQRSEIVQNVDQDWPDDLIEREAAIKIDITTEAVDCLDQLKLGMLRHLAFLYENRGDCSDKDLSDAAKRSGASMFYDQRRISRV